MRFLLIKVPQSNEYTYEQTLALLSSLNSKAKGGSLFSLFGGDKSPVFSLNIISIKQNIFFLAAADEDSLEQLKNQLLAQYGKADISEIENFSEFTNINYEQVVLGELVPTRSIGFPINTIDKMGETDPMASILSTISRSPDPNALFWVQIIIKPTGTSWQTSILSRINKINSAETKTQGMQNEIEQLQEKIRYHGFNANVRVIADSEANLQSLFNSFNVFTSTSGNRFVLKRPNFLNEKKLRQAVENHSQYGSTYILNNIELASIWHAPKGTLNIPNIVWGKRLQLDAPENLPIAYQEMSPEQKRDITFLGKVNYKNRQHIFGIRNKDRLRHIYIVGKTGTGKSWFIDNMAIEDIRKGSGIAVLDPHGDAIDTIMQYIPKNRINDVCYFNPADMEYAYPLNVFDIENESQKELMVSGIIAIFYKLYSHSWGPRMEHILRNVLFTLTYAPDATLPDILKVLHNRNYRNKILENVSDQTLIQFWKNDFDGMSEKFANEAIAPILNKIGQFVTSPLIRKVIQYPKSKVKIEDIMNNRKIFLCDLSQGKLGEDNATLLGSMIITKIQIAAMNRAFMREEDRVPFYLYVDEFQNFATQSFTKILSEARKYKLGLTLANQYITQIDEDVMGAILGNVGTISCFNVGAKDSEILHKEFGTNIEPEDLTSMEQHQMIMRMMIDNVSSPAFTYYSLPLPKNISGHKDKIIEQSRKQFGVKVK